MPRQTVSYNSSPYLVEKYEDGSWAVFDLDLNAIHGKLRASIKKKAKKEFKKMQYVTIGCNPAWIPEATYSLGNCVNAVPLPHPVEGNPTMEKTMCYDCDDRTPTTDLGKARNYLEMRLHDVSSEKMLDLGKAFGIDNDDAPNTPKEFVKRIQDGKFTIDKRFDGDDAPTYVYDPARYIIWRDPTVKKDQAGYDAATEKLNKARTAAEDAIRVLDPATDGLKALQDFESASFN